MSNKHQIEDLDGITKILFRDTPTFDEVKTIIDDIAKNYSYERRLWNFSNIDFHFTINELHDIAEYGKVKFVKPNKMAIVSPNINVDIEMVIFKVYRTQEGHSKTRAFRTESEAIEWLNN